jgi:transcriptional regulator with XRE-family HTH domain
MKVTLKAARVNKRLTQAEVAREMGWGVDRVKYIEKNSDNIEYKTLLQLCVLYDCTIDDIFLPFDFAKSELNER